MKGAGSRRYIRSPQNFFSGLVLIVFALLVLWLVQDLQGMHGPNFGPATAPRLLAVLLLLTGAIIVVSGLLIDGPRLERWPIRGPVLLIASTLFFAATVRPLGLAVSSFGTILLACAASKEVRWIESLVWSAVLTAASLAVFSYALGLPLKPWPW